jgi:hypothetical protein
MKRLNKKDIKYNNKLYDLIEQSKYNVGTFIPDKYRYTENEVQHNLVPVINVIFDLSNTIVFSVGMFNITDGKYINVFNLV